MNEEGNYKEPACGKYRLDAAATYTDEFGQKISDTASGGFDVQRYSYIWRWLFWLVILLLIILLILFMLTRKAWPKEMYFYCPKGSGRINIGKNMNVVSGIYPGVLSCVAEKNSALMRKFGRQASIKITKVDPAWNVKSFQIGRRNVYTRDGGKFLDSNGKEFKEESVKHNISDWTFSECSKLNRISILDSVNEIGEGAFCNCKLLDELIVPDTVEKIDDCAFRGCESLERILIPSSVIELGWGLFDECSDDLVVYCDEDSEIRAYCERNKIKNDRICNMENN